MDSQSWFLQWVGVADSLFFFRRQYATLEIRGAVLGSHVGHESCCCSAVSEPANGPSMGSQSWFLQWVVGRCGRSFVFLGRQYATLEIRGAVLGRHVGHDSCCCSAVSEPANGLLKLVWTLKAGFCNG